MRVEDKDGKFADYSLAAHLSNLDCVFAVLAISNSLISCFFFVLCAWCVFPIFPKSGNL